MELFAIHNIVFLIAIAVGFIMMIGTVMGFGHGTDHDLDNDVSHDVGHDASHDAGHDGGHDGDGKTGNPLDTSPEAGYRSPLWLKVLSLVGIGKVPLTLWLMIASLLFGCAGMMANFALEPVLKFPALYGWLSLGIAVFVMLALTGRLARLISRLMPQNETYTVTRRELVGSTGTLVLPADETKGLAQVRSESGDLFQIQCRTFRGSLPKAKGILVVDYDEKSGIYYVSPDPGEL